MEHHAYLYEGPQELLEPLRRSACRRFGVAAAHSPDVHILRYERFGIEEARSLRAQAALKSVSGRALFILGLSSMTSEAQQALLKLFEEPQGGVVFILLLPKGALIPTLRSRLLPYPERLARPEGGEAGKFLRAPYAARSAALAALLKEEEGQRERVRQFLDALEEALFRAFQTSRQRALQEGLEDIARIRSYAGDRSPSLKMLLEHLALSLPAL